MILEPVQSSESLHRRSSCAPAAGRGACGGGAGGEGGGGHLPSEPSPRRGRRETAPRRLSESCAASVIRVVRRVGYPSRPARPGEAEESGGLLDRRDRFDQLVTGRFDQLVTGRFDQLVTGRFDQAATGRLRRFDAVADSARLRQAIFTSRTGLFAGRFDQLDVAAESTGPGPVARAGFARGTWGTCSGDVRAPSGWEPSSA